LEFAAARARGYGSRMGRVLLCSALLLVACDASKPTVDSIVAEARANVERRVKLGQSFIDEIARGDVAAAYARTSKVYRETVPLERFEKGVRAHPYLRAGGKYSAANTVSMGSSIEVRGTLMTSDGAVAATLHLLGTKDGDWISAFTIAGQPALPLPAP
jgi:hypothetical protein